MPRALLRKRATPTQQNKIYFKEGMQSALLVVLQGRSQGREQLRVVFVVEMDLSSLNFTVRLLK